MKDSPFEGLRKLGARYWKPLLSLFFVALPILGNSRKLLTAIGLSEKYLPLVRWAFIGIFLLWCIIILILIRFPKLASKITRLILGSPVLPSGIGRLFRGPRAYSDQDKLPCRLAEIDDCLVLIKEESFLILEGESGCGKTSFLNAGLIPRVTELFRIIKCRIADDPFGKLYSVLLDEPYINLKQTVTKSDLSKAIRTAVKSQDKQLQSSESILPLLLCIDQFEELFLTVSDKTRTSFLSILKDAIRNGELRLILSIRGDFLDLLLKTCRLVDPEQHSLNLGSYYTLSSFRKEQAKDVLSYLLEPLKTDDPLIKQQIEDFIETLVCDLLRPPRDKRLSMEDEKTVLPVELQTVGIMLESFGVKNFSVSGFTQLGGKEGLLRHYIEDTKTFIWRKTGVSGEKALLILRQLISPALTKWMQTAHSIANDLKLSVDQVESVLNAFAERYLVNKLPVEVPENTKEVNSGSYQYELMHDHLVPLLLQAPDPLLQKARENEARILFWINQTKSIFEPLKQKKIISPWKKLRSIFNQPIPIVETIRLWRYARYNEARRILKRNILSFFLRLTSACIVLTSPFLVFLGIYSLFGSAQFPANSVLTYSEKHAMFHEHKDSINSDDQNLVFLVLSGSGKRASAFSYAALKQLYRVKLVEKSLSRSLLDEVDYIFASSGASFTAAYWGLFGYRIFEDYEDRFLSHNVENVLFKEALKPTNWLRLYSPNFNRADLIAEYYGEHLFANQTFGNLWANKNSPNIYIGATELVTGTGFSFVPLYFNFINSDLSNFPVSRAVIASSASIVSTGPITLLNHSLEGNLIDNIEYRMAKRNARCDVTKDFYCKMLEYYNNRANKYIHLADVGLGSSQGLQFIIDQFATNGIINKKLSDRENPLRRLMIIHVNSDINLFLEQPSTEDLRNISFYMQSRTISSAMDYITARRWVEIKRLSTELERAILELKESVASLSKLEAPYIVEISFRNISDDDIRAKCNEIPSRTFNLTSEQLDLINNVVTTLVAEDLDMIRFKETLKKTKVEN